MLRSTALLRLRLLSPCAVVGDMAIFLAIVTRTRRAGVSCDTHSATSSAYSVVVGLHVVLASETVMHEGQQRRGNIERRKIRGQGFWSVLCLGLAAIIAVRAEGMSSIFENHVCLL